MVGRFDDNETLFAGHNVVSVLLHSNRRKPMLYNGLLSFTPVPDLPGSPSFSGSGLGSRFESTNLYFIFAVRNFLAYIATGRPFNVRLFFGVFGLTVPVYAERGP